MNKSLQTNKKIETGLIIRKDNVFSKIQRLWNTIFFKEEMNVLQKIEKYLLKPRKAIKNVIIPKEIESKGNKYEERDNNSIYK